MTNYLLDRLLRQLEDQFLAEGGFTERLYEIPPAGSQAPAWLTLFDTPRNLP